ncbi:hypothetical protein ACJMK2_023708 [Sinanodonta woodiana]|uniref:Cytochrome b561 n=1 Tax=Sinanodonta woodiana TaxID=1069815 RepID=A0ABD3T5V3_SINWO
MKLCPLPGTPVRKYIITSNDDEIMSLSRYTSMENFNKPEPPVSLGFFTFLVLVIQGLGLAAVILVAVWMGHFHEGFAWQTEPKLEFNYHPVFMVIGMIFLYTDGMSTIYYDLLMSHISNQTLLFTYLHSYMHTCKKPCIHLSINPAAERGLERLYMHLKLFIQNVHLILLFIKVCLSLCASDLSAADLWP